MERKELLSPIVSVEVLPAKYGEKVIVPSQWRRHIFKEVWGDMLALRRVSTHGGITGAFHSSIAFPYLCSSVDDPQRLYEENLPEHSWYLRYSSTKRKLFVRPPQGYDAIYVDEPIRGVIPAPMISTVRFSAPAAAWDYEDLTPEKYTWEEFKPAGIGQLVAFNPVTGLKTYYSSVNLIEHRTPDGKLFVYPVLQEAAREIDTTIIGLRGTYLLATPIGADVWQIRSNGNDIGRRQLLDAAIHNTKLIIQSNAPTYLPMHPSAIGYEIKPTDYVYDIRRMSGMDLDTPPEARDYKLYTLASMLFQTPPALTGDFSFMFVLQLATPESQLYHLYSQTSTVRLFFGGHYMLDFIPGGAAGVGSVYFYFFPYGYTIPQEVLNGERPAAHTHALIGGQQATLAGTYRLFHLSAFVPIPTENRFYSPFVYYTEINQMDVWTLSRASPGATAEAFLITCLKGHLCIFKYTDIERSMATGEPLKPIFAFNPVEYVRRHFGDKNIINYFLRHTIPPYTSVGLFLCNTNAYISFADFTWRGFSIATPPMVIAPAVDDYPTLFQNEFMISSGRTYYYYPTSLLGTKTTLKKLTTAPYEFPSKRTELREDVEKTKQYMKLPHTFAYPVLHYYQSPYAESVRPLPYAVEVVKENIPTTIATTTSVSVLSAIISLPLSAQALYSTTSSPILQEFHPPAKSMRAKNPETEDEQKIPTGIIPSLDLGISPIFYKNYDEFVHGIQNLHASTVPVKLWEAQVKSLRFPLSPPLLLACDLVTVGIFSLGDIEWRNAVDLAALPTELGVGTIVNSIDVTLRGLGESSATISLQVPYEYNVQYSYGGGQEQSALILSLPPILADVLKPYNLVRIRLGYTLYDYQRGAVTTLSPVIFEGIIDSISTQVSEQAAGGRTLNITVNCVDIFARLAQSTVEYEPPLDGFFFPEVLEHHLINSGISPHRIISHTWIPLGAISSFALGENLLIGGADAYYSYYDYPFHVGAGLAVLADAPRFTVSAGSRRLDIIKTAARICGVTVLPTPYPIDTTQFVTFLDYLLRTQTYEAFSPTFQGFVNTLKMPYTPSLPISGAGRNLFAQVIPVGAYATKPTWEFLINTGEFPEIAYYDPQSVFVAKVMLPDNPFVQGIFSLRLEASAYQLPTLVRIEGRRLTNQPLFFLHHDYWTELYARNSYRYKGFRIAAVPPPNQQIVEPIQAFLAAWRNFLQQGYFPPIRASLTVFGIPNLAPYHLVSITPPLRIVGEESIISEFGTGLRYWVVDWVSYSWRAGNIPTAQVTLRPPHPFIVGLIG